MRNGPPKNGRLASRWLVPALIAAAIGTTHAACGGGDTNGWLCQACSVEEPCQDQIEVSGNDRPSFCGDIDPCQVALLCKQRVDSAAQRCFPAQPGTTPALDEFYRCDGDRPNPNS